MKKSNLILAGMVVLLVLLGFLYLIPVREGLACPTDAKDCNDYTKTCVICKRGNSRSVTPSSRH